MKRLLGLLALALSGCLYYFDGDDDDDKICPLVEPAGAPAPLRDPDRLTCHELGYGCDDPCGACPEDAPLPIAPPPSWGICGGSCDGLDEGTCAERGDCRVVRDAACAIRGTCETDFLGCFPIDMNSDPSTDCREANDGWTCSKSAACTAFHTGEPCLGIPEAACARPFVLCMPEGQSPGQCHAPVACRALPPPCPSGTTPGVVNLCWSGACIPDELCEPAT